MEENLGSVILENNRIAVIRPDGTLEILVVSAGRTEPISISSFSPSDTQLLLDLLAGKKAAQQNVQADKTICACGNRSFTLDAFPNHCGRCGKPFRG